ncbi:hypothetical protein ACSDR0_44815 [Streptosporangium sp. G11]|uniref:hypothetical protein n=1 Tax=Streptosporangium sp. G11 TaxID=3436926 RepID=UPI003EBAA59E
MVRAISTIVAIITTIISVLVFSAMPAAAEPPPSIMEMNTNASIECDSWPLDAVLTQANGTGFLPGRVLWVERYIYIDGEQWIHRGDKVTVSASGTWSKQLTYETALDGEYDLYVYVQDNKTKQELGMNFDSVTCNFQPKTPAQS